MFQDLGRHHLRLCHVQRNDLPTCFLTGKFVLALVPHGKRVAATYDGTRKAPAVLFTWYKTVKERARVDVAAFLSTTDCRYVFRERIEYMPLFPIILKLEVGTAS